MDTLVLFLKEGTLPGGKGEANKVRRKSPHFWLSKEQKLYKCSFSDHTCSVSILKQWSHFWRSCMRESMKVIQAASHYPMGPLPRGIGGQVCKKKYWSMWRSVINAKDLLQTFISQGVSSIFCLVHGHFAQQGLDIVGPFPKAAGNWRWNMIGTNYFTKWVEAEPLSNIRDLDANKFVWKNIVTQFGIPQTLISDNGL